MSDRDQPDGQATEQVRISRRRLLAAVALGGGAAALLPERWVKPVVDTVLLPAHAQATVIQNFGLYRNNGNGNNLGQGSPRSGSLLDRLAGTLIGSAVARELCTPLPRNTFCVSFDVPQPPETNVAIHVFDFDRSQLLTGFGTLVGVNQIGDVQVTNGNLVASFSQLSVQADDLTGFMNYDDLGANVTTACYEMELQRRDDGLNCGFFAVPAVT